MAENLYVWYGAKQQSHKIAEKIRNRQACSTEYIEGMYVWYMWYRIAQEHTSENKKSVCNILWRAQ